MEEKLIYRSYLLRLWLVEQNGDPVWRASLEEANSGQRQVFTDLETLFNYVRKITAEGTGTKKG